MTAEHRECAPLAVGGAAGMPPDEHHEDGDQGQRDRDEHPADPVDNGYLREDDDRYDHREHKLGQEPSEVAVEGVDPAGDQGRELARRCSRVRRPVQTARSSTAERSCALTRAALRSAAVSWT